MVARHLNRPVSTRVSRVLARTNVSPNQVTYATLAVGLFTGLVMGIGGYSWSLIGAALFQLTSILDGVDGELARLKFRESKRGEWLDTFADNLSYLAALVGLIVGVARSDAGSTFLWYGGLFAGGMTLSAFLSLYWYLPHRESAWSAWRISPRTPTARSRPTTTWR